MTSAEDITSSLHRAEALAKSLNKPIYLYCNPTSLPSETLLMSPIFPESPLVLLETIYPPGRVQLGDDNGTAKAG